MARRCGGCSGGQPAQGPKPVKAPTIHPDGTVELPEGMDIQIDGYVPSEDGNRLVPEEGCHCIWRITGIMLKRDGGYAPHHVCRNSECEHKTKPVTFDICRGCPFREE